MSDERGHVMVAIQEVLTKIADRNQYATTQETMFLDEISATLRAAFEGGEDFVDAQAVLRELNLTQKRLLDVVRIVEEKTEVAVGDRLRDPWDCGAASWYHWTQHARSSLVARKEHRRVASELGKTRARLVTQGAKKPTPKGLRWLVRKIIYGVNA